jgi:hypothetical protein
MVIGFGEHEAPRKWIWLGSSFAAWQGGWGRTMVYGCARRKVELGPG